MTALKGADEGRLGSTGWRFSDGAVGPGGSTTDQVRHYAVLGDADWDHVTVRALVDPACGSAGVAVAVAGLPKVEQALLAVVDEDSARLRILARRAGSSRSSATGAASSAPCTSTRSRPT